MLKEFTDLVIQYFGGWLPLAAAAGIFLLLIVLRKKIPCGSGLLLFTAGLLLLVLNPFARMLWTKMIQPHLYWRSFWLLPLPLAAGLVAAALAGEGRLLRRILVLGLCLGCLALAGKNVYTRENFQKPDNPFKLPSQAVAVANAVLPEEGETRALVPDDLFCYIRQYSSRIRMPYGRNIAGFTSPVTNPRILKLHKRMNQKVYRAAKICTWAARYKCEYIVFLADRPVKKKPEDYGYIKTAELGNYVIYRWTEAG